MIVVGTFRVMNEALFVVVVVVVVVDVGRHDVQSEVAVIL